MRRMQTFLKPGEISLLFADWSVLVIHRISAFSIDQTFLDDDWLIGELK